MKFGLALIFLLAGVGLGPDKVADRFKAPDGFAPVAVAPDSFGAWLQSLPLKPAGTPTRTYTGEIARTNPYTAAVFDMSVGKEDLQQCADAVMRLRGEYLYHQQKYAAIAFHFTDGFNCDFVHYADGYRYLHGKWALKAKKDYGYANFMRYMQLVFAYAGTLSLEKELIKISRAGELKAGDIFIHGGSPGHCLIVLEVIENSRHQKQFLLAQSFMPAQNIQLVQDGSPWFSMDRTAEIPYGELTKPEYLRKFRD